MPISMLNSILKIEAEAHNMNITKMLALTIDKVEPQSKYGFYNAYHTDNIDIVNQTATT